MIALSLPTLALYATGAVSVAATTLLFVSSAVYDVRSIQRRRHLIAFPGSRRYRKRPLVSIIIVARSQRGLEETIRSISKSSYRKHEVIIVGNGVQLELEPLKHLYPRIIFNTKHHLVAYEKAQHSGLARSAGEIVVYLMPGTQLQVNTLKNTVEHFLIDDNLQFVTGRIAYSPGLSISSQFLYVRGIVQDYAARLISIKKRYVRQPAFLAVRRQAPPMAKVAALYASNAEVKAARPVTLRQQGLRPKPRLQTCVWWFSRLYLLVAIAYAGYLAVILEVHEPLLALWFGVALLCVLLVLFDPSHKLGKKTWVVLLSPAWFPLTCIYTILQTLKPVAVIRRVRIKFSLAP